jgi:DNA-directed RNA polymerase specialized sigma24 family protein
MDPYFYVKCTASLEALASLAKPDSLNDKIPGLDGIDIEVGDLIADPKPSVEDRIIKEELHEQVRAFVLGLPDYLRCIAIRLIWLNHSPHRIARDLGRSRAAIYDAIARIKRTGSKQLSPLLR